MRGDLNPTNTHASTVPLVDGFEALYRAVTARDEVAVERLLKVKSVWENAAAQDNEALRSAVLMGDEVTVKSLLEIPSVKKNAAIKNNDALISAASDGHAAIVESLLEIASVKKNAATQDNEALISAASGGHAAIVESLLKVESVRKNAAAQDNEALRSAVRGGHTAIVKSLLEIPSVKEDAANVLTNDQLMGVLGKDRVKMLEVIFEHIPQDAFNASLPGRFNNDKLIMLLQKDKIETLLFILSCMPEERLNKFYDSEAVQVLQSSIIQKVRLLIVGGALHSPVTNPLGMLSMTMVIEIATRFILASYPSSASFVNDDGLYIKGSAEKNAERIYANVCGLSHSVLFPSSVAVSKNGGSAPLLEV